MSWVETMNNLVAYTQHAQPPLTNQFRSSKNSYSRICAYLGIQVVGKRCWKYQEFRTFKYWKTWSWKIFVWTWRLMIDVSKFWSWTWVIKKFPTSIRTLRFFTFQLHFGFSYIKLSKFEMFPTTLSHYHVSPQLWF